MTKNRYALVIAFAAALGLAPSAGAQSWKPPAESAALPVEVGRRRRARLRQPHETRKRAEGCDS